LLKWTNSSTRRKFNKYFVEVVPKDGKIFWLEFRHKFETLNEQSSVLFPLGEVYLITGAQDALKESNQMPNEFLAKQQTDTWGVVDKEDWK